MPPLSHEEINALSKTPTEDNLLTLLENFEPYRQEGEDYV